MTRRTSDRSNSARRAAHRGGFTLVEMLVVIGIIVLLIGLLSPMISRAYRNAERARVAADLNAVSTALEAYKQDFGYYVPVPTNMTGANMLARGLIAPGTQAEDGVDGPGFRVSKGFDPSNPSAGTNLNTKAYPPYLNPEVFKLIDVNGNTVSNSSGFIADRFKKPILYFVANGKPTITAPTGMPYVADTSVTPNEKPMYDFRQNKALWTSTDGLKSMQLALGDFDFNGRINGNEQARFQGPYMLWSAGPNESYGPQKEDAGPLNVLDHFDADAYDDITNFRS
jgi:prepilin-type N-terminal cleavage/methylation domain-containing protein